ncbi:uncharacterized protein [Montipora foliosa]|uniref:uncharacterized protein isoform X2 n=1 Tax=Montipora foliosa TaxID=591990 RepID=UPI0035F164C5
MPQRLLVYCCFCFFYFIQLSFSTADVDAQLYKNVISSMRNDSISSIARRDQLITNFGAAIFEKVGIKNANYVSQRMRQLARLLQTLRLQNKRNDATLEEFIDTSMFDTLVDAVKELCRFDEESRLEIGIPSLALKLGHSLKKCAQVLKSSALRKKDEDKIKRAKRFLDLYEADWTSKISSRSLASLGSRKQNKIEYLPLAEDLSLLRKHLDLKIVALSKVLTETKKVESWNKLAKATLAKIIIFNKRRSGETATLEIEQFQRRPDWSKCSSSLKESLTPLERRLCERLDLIEISGKRSRKVPILLTPETKTAVGLLIEKRPDSIPKENKFVFARASKGSLGHLRGWDCVSDSVKEIQATLKKPKEITSTKLRKYIATVSQAAALTEVDVDWLARHLGHDVRVHREFYRLHESTTELAKVSKLLMAVDSGNIRGVVGKSLAEMTVEDIPDITNDSASEESSSEEENNGNEDTIESQCHPRSSDETDVDDATLRMPKRTKSPRVSSNGKRALEQTPTSHISPDFSKGKKKVSANATEPRSKKKSSSEEENNGNEDTIESQCRPRSSDEDDATLRMPKRTKSPDSSKGKKKVSTSATEPRSKKSLVEKRPWTSEEKKAVLSQLGRYITSGVVPGKDACDECIRKSQGALSKRGWTAIKFFVKNEIHRRKRMIEKKDS